MSHEVTVEFTDGDSGDYLAVDWRVNDPEGLLTIVEEDVVYFLPLRNVFEIRVPNLHPQVEDEE